MSKQNVDFIFKDYIQDIDLCLEIIDMFNASSHKEIGLIVKYGNVICDPNFKDSVDLDKWEPKILARYIASLQSIVDKYIAKFPYCNQGSPWRVLCPPNIQFYQPKAGYKEWHTERNGCAEPSVSRHLVFMTYLNDVTDGGETEFYHQNMKIKPKTGLTVIWPSDWTHYHRGVPSPTQEKYIVTGWFNYVDLA